MVTKAISPRILAGDVGGFDRGLSEFNGIPIDQDLGPYPDIDPNQRQSTIDQPVELSGKGTFARKNTTNLRFEPYDKEGWWLDRTDLPGELPIRVSVRNVWTTGQIVSNIVLRSGGPRNYVRLVEHMVAMKMGLGVDRMMIRIDSGDPPLFDRGSMDIVEALDRAGRRPCDAPVRRFTVKEPVAVASPQGQFVMIEPCDPDKPGLTVDCGVAFNTAIGQQRIRFPVTEEWIRHGAVARTNTPHSKAIYCWTIGKLFADVRNLGYSKENVLIAGRKRYINEPRLIHEGKSLEATWHRGVLDLLAALALVEEGQLAGHVTSYKAGHRMDVLLITQLYMNDLLVPVSTPRQG